MSALATVAVATMLLWFLTLFVVYVLNKQIKGWRATAKHMFLQNTELVGRMNRIESLIGKMKEEKK